MPLYMKMSENLNETMGHLKFRYISILTNLLRTVRLYICIFMYIYNIYMYICIYNVYICIYIIYLYIIYII